MALAPQLNPQSGFQFFPRYEVPLKLNPKLQVALNHAIEGWTVLKTVAIAIVDITNLEAENYPYAGNANHDKRYYSGSLLKVAALFATYELLDLVNRYAPQLTARSPGGRLQELSAMFDPRIRSSIVFPPETVRRNRAPAKLERDMLVPDYKHLLREKQSDEGLRFALSTESENKLTIMIDQGEGRGATAYIHRLGYAWINGLLQKAGFIRSTRDGQADPGIWLAGDYTKDSEWPSARVPSENDGMSAEATTARDMAKLFTLIKKRSMTETSSASALAHLAKAHNWLDSDLAKFHLKAEAAKVGLGNLKPEFGALQVSSEGSIISDPGSADPKKPRFVVVWQNVIHNHPDLALVARILGSTIQTYLGSP